MANIEFQSHAELNSAMEALALASRKTLREVIPPQVRLFAADLAANTRPFGKSAGGQKEAQEKIGARIGEIYKPIGAAVEAVRKAAGDAGVGRFERYLKTKNFTAAETMYRSITGSRSTIGPWDGGRLHSQQKDRKKIQDVLIVVGSFKPVESYIRAKQKQVGFAKGGFATAARELGGVRGIPGYATRHRSPGRGIIQEDGNGLTVTIENNVKYIEHAYDAHSEARAVDFRIRSINSVINRIGERRLKEATRHVK